ncbi:hypothetical protein E2C01_047079 [Portunus trituberculatus]|uniref:Uncharacterized protein n=1 Tax=Portunus trituberculatus TaxID=210409 RepID=A0A5B7G2N6_PORTR|nr:hypothetical protein [Portunus trituberculatus]
MLALKKRVMIVGEETGREKGEERCDDTMANHPVKEIAAQTGVSVRVSQKLVKQFKDDRRERIPASRPQIW